MTRPVDHVGDPPDLDDASRITATRSAVSAMTPLSCDEHHGGAVVAAQARTPG
jgi:hypothetical protein